MPATDEVTPFDDGALYDAILGEFDYGIDFYLGLAKSADGPALDLACGTGRVLLPCMRAGVDIDGVDLFAGMLARLMQKAAAAGLAPRVFQADMRSFRLERRYRLIIITFNAFVHCLTTDEQIATLVRCREHLVPGGQLAFDTYFPGAAIITAADNVRVMEMETIQADTGFTVRMYDTRTFDRVHQLQHSRMDIEIVDANGVVVAVHHPQTTVRWIYKGEMELLLRAAGFARWKISGNFDGDPLVRETDSMIVQAWSAGDATSPV